MYLCGVLFRSEIKWNNSILDSKNEMTQGIESFYFLFSLKVNRATLSIVWLKSITMNTNHVTTDAGNIML
jgi:hypothetical protein